jgi:hypothetical protein
MMHDAPWMRVGRSAWLIAVTSLTLTACAFHWPWTRRPAAAPPSAHAVDISADTAAGPPPIAQYWDRNTLLLDLTGVSGEGAARLAPIPAQGGWPVRLEFRVRPGSIGRLEVLAGQRVVYSVPDAGAPLLLTLAPGVYQPDTPSITLRWGAADGSAR